MVGPLFISVVVRLLLKFVVNELAGAIHVAASLPGERLDQCLMMELRDVPGYVTGRYNNALLYFIKISSTD